MQCEMCGSTSELFRANIEGATMTVCEKCAKYGKILEKAKAAPAAPTKAEVERQLVRQKIETETIFMISPDYPTKIKSMREKLGLKQDELAKKLNERESSIHKLETGEIEPNIALARKLEKFFGIKLVEEHQEEAKPLPLGKPGEVTLGDFARIKKR
jgi:putative transcription factor